MSLYSGPPLINLTCSYDNQKESSGKWVGPGKQRSSWTRVGPALINLTGSYDNSNSSKWAESDKYSSEHWNDKNRPFIESSKYHLVLRISFFIIREILKR